jgi:UDP-glucose 4-epimerase
VRVLVTGASGFVGSAVLKRLVSDGHEAMASVRRAPEEPVAGVSYVAGADLVSGTGWEAAVRGADAVIHAAARVHVMEERAADPLAEFRRANVDGTLRLAEAAAAAGVRRFVFLSSIKVNGETTQAGRPFRADDPPQPLDPYGVSKLEAEEALFALSQRTGMGVAVVRPPLVYGPGVKANFRAMMGLLQRRLPLPLGAARAKRSLVALENLVDLLMRCLDHPEAAGRVFLVSDGEDLSVAEMLKRLGAALGRRPLLLPVPPAAIALAARLAGRGAVAQRLLMPLQVDIEPTRRLLGWSPPVPVDEAFARTARHFLEARR